MSEKAMADIVQTVENIRDAEDGSSKALPAFNKVCVALDNRMNVMFKMIDFLNDRITQLETRDEK